MIITDYNQMTLEELIAISMLNKKYTIEDGRITGVEDAED